MKSYKASLFALMVRTALVSVFVRVTVAPGTRAPVGSVTTPLTWPGDCANAGPDANRIAMSATARLTIHLAKCDWFCVSLGIFNSICSRVWSLIVAGWQEPSGGENACYAWKGTLRAKSESMNRHS